MNDWQKLRARYGSTNQYKKRVAALPSQIEEFSNWLIDKGADVMTALAQDEINNIFIDPMYEEQSEPDQQRITNAAQKRESELFGN